jgi:hypothetical protein
MPDGRALQPAAEVRMIVSEVFIEKEKQRIPLPPLSPGSFASLTDYQPKALTHLILHCTADNRGVLLRSKSGLTVERGELREIISDDLVIEAEIPAGGEIQFSYRSKFGPATLTMRHERNNS